MADPLSVAASVVGLITAAVQISKTIANIVERSRKAPKECLDARLEVDSIRTILSELQLFVLGASKASRARTSLLLIEQIVTILAACVTTFSDLDVFVDTLDSDEKLGLLDKLRWASKAKALSEIIAKLQMRKSSLTLMLTILTCRTNIEAEDNVERLCDLVEQTLKSNAELAQRLDAFGAGATVAGTSFQTLGTNEAKPDSVPIRQELTSDPSTRNEHQALVSTQDLVPSISSLGIEPKNPAEAWADRRREGAGSPVADQAANEIADVSSQNQTSDDAHLTAAVFKRNAAGFAFEEILKESRAYRRIDADNSDGFSISSAAGRTASWSMLSGLSLSEVSNIAIVAIPVYPTDISNRELYHFGAPEKTEATLVAALGGASNSLVVPKESGLRRQKLAQKLRALRNLGSEASSAETKEPGPRVFGVALATSVRFANNAISLTNEHGESFVYGHIPVLVAKCGVYIKEKATEVEDIFASPGNPRRIHHLQLLFDAPPRYGKGLNWLDFTVQDCAGILLRYLKSLPEGPMIPYDFYDRFSEVFQSLEDYNKSVTQPVGSAKKAAIAAFQALIVALPALNRILLQYILDIMAVIASKADVNKMNSARLAATFHPSILSRKPEEMDAGEHERAVDVTVFLVDHQDYFLVGMSGTEDVGLVR